ncbi:MAG: response regulator transcription factor [Flavobacteriales bacterium]|nr:MAG: response regulator transcription factor [Flavobacteriales bacterium]
MSTTNNLLRLAVVDDHPVVRDAYAAVMDTWPRGRVVLRAEHGLDYERQCAEVGHVHIALVDLDMPVRDGFETIRWIGRHQPRTKPVALTGDPQPHRVQRSLQAGSLGVLSKAGKASDLLRALEHVHLAGFHYNDLVSKELRRSVQDAAAARPAPGDLWAKLTPREREFVLLYAHPKGYHLTEVGQRMGIKPETAESHRKNVVAKLHAKTRADLVRMVVENGWG